MSSQNLLTRRQGTVLIPSIRVGEYTKGIVKIIKVIQVFFSTLRSSVARRLLFF